MEDKLIISGCQQNNPKYQKILLEKYSGFLKSAALNYLNDEAKIMDVLQETWINIFNHIHSYEERGFFYPWAKKILLREVIKLSNKDKAKIVFLDTLKRSDLIQNPIAEKKLELEEAMKMVERIPSPAREVFKMHVIDGLSHKEIGEVMNIKDSTSRVHLTNARKHMKYIMSISSSKKVKA